MIIEYKTEIHEPESFHPSKDEWPEGPWSYEVDKINWVDPETDLDCMIVRAHSGALCGYVGVPPENKHHRKGYDSVEIEGESWGPEVHGGLTFAASCREGGKICHVPVAGRTDDVWWLGFDCNHAGDLAPGTVAILAMHARESGRPVPSFSGDGIYRTVDYLKAEVTNLAKQLAV